MGLEDEPRHGGSVKLFCPKCQDVYSSAPSFRRNNINISSYYIPRSDSPTTVFILSPSTSDLDGAYFGTTFAGLFFMSYPDLVPVRSTEVFVPRVFGFKIHESSPCVSRNKGNVEVDDSKRATDFGAECRTNIIELRHLTSTSIKNLDSVLSSSSALDTYNVVVVDDKLRNSVVSKKRTQAMPSDFWSSEEIDVASKKLKASYEESESKLQSEAV
jgi:hypothetical protein